MNSPLLDQVPVAIGLSEDLSLHQPVVFVLEHVHSLLVEECSQCPYHSRECFQRGGETKGQDGEFVHLPFKSEP